MESSRTSGYAIEHSLRARYWNLAVTEPSSPAYLTQELSSCVTNGFGVDDQCHALLVHFGANRPWSGCHHLDDAFRPSTLRPLEQVECRYSWKVWSDCRGVECPWPKPNPN